MDVPSYEFDQLIENNARKKYSCPMCQEIIIFAHKTNCNHRFCKYCITKWMMYFHDCPVCRQKILKVAPHPRTDKWIQQLFDMATAEFRQDREMCINYRKLQQVKLELIGCDAVNPKTLNHDKLLEEFAIPSEEPTDEGGKAKNDVPPPKWRLQSATTTLPPMPAGGVGAAITAEKDDLRPIYVKHEYHEGSRPGSPHAPQLLGKPKDFMNDVTALFGAESANQFSAAFCRGKGFELHKAATFSDLSSSTGSSGKTDRRTVSAGDDDFPLGVTSAHTYAIHLREGNPHSKVLTLTELTCHEDVKSEKSNPEKSDEEQTKSGGADGDAQSNGLRMEETGGDPSEIANTINMLKADTIRARIQHEIAMASLPAIQGIHRSTSASKQTATQKEKQDLQTCREALLNLRLKLLPPAKRFPLPAKERHTFSDAIRDNDHGDWGAVMNADTLGSQDRNKRSGSGQTEGTGLQGLHSPEKRHENSRKI